MKQSKFRMAEKYGHVWEFEGTGYHGDQEINNTAFGGEDGDNKFMNKSKILHNRTKKTVPS